MVWVITSSSKRKLGIWHIWGLEEVHARFWWGSVKDRNHDQDLGVVGRVMLDGSYRNLLCGCRLDLIQDRDRCQTVMNTEMKLHVL